ncbi:MAG: peptidoglycan/xylan/chitin deacetylase (PgdA/CDA1 family) [Saprospiraceae bacterium]|jgi:peptidoglycan/xylan/chitin deacetylase (PgdA/CDA1 family)
MKTIKYLLFKVLLLFVLASFVMCGKSKIDKTKTLDTVLWNGKKSAIALTYDDGLHVHLDNVRPILDTHNLKATFYVHTNSDSFQKRASEWKALAAHGHELGNHTVFHPCAGKSKGREWVSAERDLDNYSKEEIIKEIANASAVLSEIDGKLERTFAYTCGDTSVLDTSFVEEIKALFTAARGVNRDFDDLGSLDLYHLNTHSMAGHDANHMKTLVDEAIEQGSLLVFLFHGVGGEHDLTVEKEDHDELVRYIKQKEGEIWVSSMVDIAAFIKETNR